MSKENLETGVSKSEEQPPLKPPHSADKLTELHQLKTARFFRLKEGKNVPDLVEKLPKVLVRKLGKTDPSKAYKIKIQSVKYSETAPLVEDWIDSNLPASQINKILDLANDVFGDMSVATAWLRQPNLAMDNKAPIAVLGTKKGFARVKNLLLRIQYGVLA